MPRATTGFAYLTFGLAVLGVLVFTVFVTVPAWSEYGATRASRVVRAEELKSQQDFLANVDARAAELVTYESDVRALAVSFPDTFAPADLLAVLHAAGARSGMVVESLSGPRLRERAAHPAATEEPSPGDGARESSAGTRVTASPAPGPQRPVYIFSVTLTGTYAQLRAFVTEIERALQLFDVTDIDLKAAGAPGEAGGGRVSATLHLAMTLINP